MDSLFVFILMNETKGDRLWNKKQGIFLLYLIVGFICLWKGTGVCISWENKIFHTWNIAPLLCASTEISRYKMLQSLPFWKQLSDEETKQKNMEKQDTVLIL